MERLTLEEVNELNEFLFGYGSCEYDKRKKCDSFYISKYNKQLERIYKLIEYINTLDIDGEIKYKIKDILKEEENE